MRRNWTTIRELLERFETEDINGFLQSANAPVSYDSTATTAENDKNRAEQVARADAVFGHLLLLMDSDLVDGVKTAEPTVSGRWVFSLHNPRLTMKGHDTLDAIRSDTVWNAVKQRAKDSAMPVTLELILAVLKKLSLLA